ncbi:MAG: SRPBCC family protein [Parvibaculum sp.]|nr:SRPBCC family protein [Parvibaculum sp.]
MTSTKTRVGATRYTTAPAATVYAIAADSSGYPQWGGIGSFEEIRPGTESRYGKGSERIFRTAGMVIREEVMAAEPDRYNSYRLISGLPLKDYLGEITIAREGDKVRIDWYSTFIPPKGFGWFWRAFMQRILSTMSAALVKEAEKRMVS